MARQLDQVYDNQLSKYKLQVEGKIVFIAKTMQFMEMKIKDGKDLICDPTFIVTRNEDEDKYVISNN